MDRLLLKLFHTFTGELQHIPTSAYFSSDLKKLQMDVKTNSMIIQLEDLFNSSMTFTVQKVESMSFTMSSSEIVVNFIAQKILWRPNLSEAQQTSREVYQLLRRNSSSHFSLKHFLHVHCTLSNPFGVASLVLKLNLQHMVCMLPKLNPSQRFFNDILLGIRDSHTNSNMKTHKLFISLLNSCLICEGTDGKSEEWKLEVDRGKVHVVGSNYFLFCADNLLLNFIASSSLSLKDIKIEWIEKLCRCELNEIVATLSTDGIPVLIALFRDVYNASVCAPELLSQTHLEKDAENVCPQVDLSSFGFTEYEIDEASRTYELSISGNFLNCLQMIFI